MPDPSPDYFHALIPSTPPALRTHLLALPHATVHAVDALLRFVLGAPCPPGADPAVRAAWAGAQREAAGRVRGLGVVGGSGVKRLHEEEEGDGACPAGNYAAAKRHKTEHPSDPKSAPAPASEPVEEENEDKDDEEDDPPRFTLHALSLTAPIHKKADITVHARTLRLTSPTTSTNATTNANTSGGKSALEAPPIPLTALKRAFLLPTRGKSRPHWTVLLMAHDVPPSPNPKDKQKDKDKDKSVVFGVDALPASALSTSSFGSSQSQIHGQEGRAQAETTVRPKGTPSEPALRAFLGFLSVPVLEPHTAVFRSALAGPSASSAGAGAGVEAYRGAKPGTLWFLREGVLWDGRPAEFFAMRDLVPARTTQAGVGGGAGGGEGEGMEGVEEGRVEPVRTISATGRTCSVLIRRLERTHGPADPDEGGEGEGDGEGGATVVEVDFGMVDGREQEGIARWVRQHRHLFGRRPDRADHLNPDHPDRTANNNAGSTGGEGKGKGKGKAVEDDSEDEDDEDFVASESDGGSATSEEDEEDGDGSGAETVDEDGDGDGDASGDGASAEDEGEEEEEGGALDPARHPLLRPGAMPKRVSRAAMDMVVGLVEESFAGPRAGPTATVIHAEDEEEDEEDELED